MSATPALHASQPASSSSRSDDGLFISPGDPDPQAQRSRSPTLKARPIHHRLRDSIEAHLSIVFAALAVTRWIEATTGVTTKQLVKTLRRYRTIEIQAGEHIITAEDPLPPEVTAWLDAIHARP